MASQQQKTFNNISNEQQQQQQQNPQETEPYRATAQQNSIDAIRAAEERYAQSKGSGSAALQHTKDCVVHGVAAGTNYVSGKGIQGYEVAKEAAVVTAQKTAEIAKQAAVKAKDVTVGAGQATLNYATGKTGEVKEPSLAEEIGEDKEKQTGRGGVNVLIGEEEGRGGGKI